jgi:hypothetical protein
MTSSKSKQPPCRGRLLLLKAAFVGANHRSLVPSQNREVRTHTGRFPCGTGFASQSVMIRPMTAGGALCLALALVNDAGAQPGNGQLVGRSVLAAKGCGKQRASFAATVVTDADGTWSAQDSEGQHFTGTSTPKGVSGRKLDVAFDPETEAASVAGLMSDVAELCETPAVSGSAGGRSGTARYRVKAKGPWTPAAAPAAALARGVARTFGGELQCDSNGST